MTVYIAGCVIICIGAVRLACYIMGHWATRGIFLRKYIFRRLIIRHWVQSYLFILIPSRKKLSLTKKKKKEKRLKFRIDSAASSEGQGKLTYCMYFSWPPLETALSISTFCSLLSRYWRSVDPRKKLPSIKHQKVHFLMFMQIKMMVIFVD